MRNDELEEKITEQADFCIELAKRLRTEIDKNGIYHLKAKSRPMSDIRRLRRELMDLFVLIEQRQCYY